MYHFFLGLYIIFEELYSLHYLILPCIHIQWPHLIYVLALVFILNCARSLKWFHFMFCPYKFIHIHIQHFFFVLSLKHRPLLVVSALLSICFGSLFIFVPCIKAKTSCWMVAKRLNWISFALWRMCIWTTFWKAFLPHLHLIALCVLAFSLELYP